jgi:hypothetical protein
LRPRHPRRPETQNDATIRRERRCRNGIAPVIGHKASDGHLGR